MMPSFLEPALLWSLAVILPAIVILYFLKLRREPLTISSTLLWGKAMEDMRVNAPFQRLKRNLLLILQLLIALAAIGALARPFLKMTLASGKQAALIIDCSASMSTKDEVDGKSRLDAAKEKANAIIDGLAIGSLGALGAADQLCVISVSDSANVLCALTSDRTRLREAVASIAQRDTVTDMESGLRVAIAALDIDKAADNHDGESDNASGASAKAATARHRQAAVILLTDGAFGSIPVDLAAKLSPAAPEGESQYIKLGRTESDNCALTAADLRDDTRGSSYRRFFLRLENFQGAAREVKVSYYINKQYFSEKAATLPAASGSAGATTLSIVIPAEAKGELEARLEPDDSLSADNHVFCSLSRQEQVRVALVGKGNPFLADVFAAMPQVVCERIAPEDWQPSKWLESGLPEINGADGLRPCDLVVFDGFAPGSLPEGTFLFFNAVPPLPGMAKDEKEPEVFWLYVTDWNRAHPLMSQISVFDDFGIGKGVNLKLEGAWARIVDAQGVYGSEKDKKDAALHAVPLVVGRIGDQRRVAVVAFDIMQTQLPGWPAKISFPLFVANAVDWLTNANAGIGLDGIRTGEPIRLRGKSSSGTESFGIVKRPDNVQERLRLPAGASTLFINTGLVGFYRVEIPGMKEKAVAANLLSPQESSNAARINVAFGSQLIEGNAEPVKSNQELWPYLLFFALIFLMVEWHIYNRRILG